jgi:hypothetical protein
MRTIAADWPLPQGKSGNWLSNLWARLRRLVREANAHNPVVQADAAAFVSAFMRIG